MNGKIIANELHKILSSILGVENNPEIQEKLSMFGYTPDRIAEGKVLYENVTHLMTIQVEEYSNQYIATDEFTKFWKRVYGNYMITLKVLRVAFNGQIEMLQRFNATGKRNKSLSGWLRDAIILYSNLLNNTEALNVMSKYGYTSEKLEKEFQEVTEVEQLHSKKLSEKGAAQQSTIERDEAFDTLYKWYRNFRAIARIALHDKPQLLETLGIVKK
ncbi:MAG: hypothetical protein LBG80_12495 [Bacteroidales bacterium]|jgi:hemoglobin-like flavoprotein|nr:hypothetical protein [Bacteroidales bacterium]